MYRTYADLSGVIHIISRNRRINWWYLPWVLRIESNLKAEKRKSVTA